MKIKREIYTRTDVVLLFLDWVRPLKEHYSQGAANLEIGDNASHYNKRAAHMEGYARVLWGLGPLFASKNQNLSPTVLSEIASWKKLVRCGLINGTDPEHEEYWGDVGDYDQKMVEMAAIINAILLSPDTLWEPLTSAQHYAVCQWFSQINHHEVYNNNWRFFRILVNMFFLIKGCPDYNKKRMEEDWKVIEQCYEGDGWYFDGHIGQKDYYIPFAMHYYGLLYSAYMKNREPERCAILKHRAEQFLDDFLYWFDCSGREVPFGRSLTYRFAHSAFFSALAFSEAKVDLSVLKHMVLGNLRYWSSQPIFDNGGIMTIGYHYPNLIMSEHYNAPGSPYWSLKTFLILALPEAHDFWQCKEQEPVFKGHKILEKANMIAVHEDSGHTLLFPAGQHSHNFGNTQAKYQKLVYSNQFGFSVQRGHELEDGAFDNTLAVTVAQENEWHMKNGEEYYYVTTQFTRMKYMPIKGVMVETVVIPLRKGHVRIHFIQSDIEAEYADGGFAIQTEWEEQEMTPEMIYLTEEMASCDFPWGNAGAVCLKGSGQARIIKAFPNTNLMYGSTVIPTIYYCLCAGTHCVADYFFGDGIRGEISTNIGKNIEIPQVVCQSNMVEILYQSERIAIKNPF